MPDQNEKERRKKIMEELQQKAEAAFELSLPVNRDTFKKLFNYLDEELGKHDCDDSLKLTEIFLSANNIKNSEAVLSWLHENSGYCDCEVLANVEQLFEN